MEEHPLFFEAKDLTDRGREKVRRYFQKTRESGGGDCGMIEKVGGDTYRIGFHSKDVQEKVLQRKFHTISLPEGKLQLTVSRTGSPQTLDQPSTSHSQAFTKSSTKGLEKIFPLDIFLMYYLRDNPRGFKMLQKQLSSIGCTVELRFDEEEAVVRGDIEKGPGGGFGGAAEQWELQVDRVVIGVTESYTCHHVFEPKQVRMLLQDASFASDDIKVYTERGYAVVVGEIRAVKERIELLEKSLPTRREVPVTDKKLKLVEEEFSREMRVKYPEVKISRGSSMIILEGPGKEVQSGAAKLNELINDIKEKRVPLVTALLNFLTVSGAVNKYQTHFQQSLRNPVSIEVGPELVLSSLSSDSLDEAEAAVSRDLSLVTVQLQGATAVPPDLDGVKEALIKGKNRINSGELRVDVSFIPGAGGTTATKVRLVGYNEYVNKLKDHLNEYLMKQVDTQDVLALPHPELVDCFDRFLLLAGMKQIKVDVKASHSPYPCVRLSGPRCLVEETKQALVSALACVTMDTLTLDGPGAQRYFRAEGKDNKELVESSYEVLIKEYQGGHYENMIPKPRSVTSPSTSTPRQASPRSRVYSDGRAAVNKTNLKIKLGGLENEQVNVLVVPMLKTQLTSTNIGIALSNKAGNVIKAKFDLAAANRPLVPGDVLQVDAPPSLGCSKIFFIQCIPWDGVRGKSVQALGNGLKKCLDLCVQQQLSSVAFPIIGPGVALKYPLREAIQVLTETIHQFGSSASAGSLSTIHVVIKPGYPDSEECYHDVFDHLSLNLNQGGQAIFGSLTSDLADITMRVGGGAKLKLVFGDITNETTDAVVNTTDFVNFQLDGVCKDILNVAGPQVEAELKAAKVTRGIIYKTQSGNFPCKMILHVCGEKDASLVEQLVCDIIECCEIHNLKSVAIPALCAGIGGLDAFVVAGAILRGIKTATSSAPLSSLTDIRLILLKIDVFLAFKEEATQMFSTAVVNRGPVPVPRTLHRQPPVTSVSADLSLLHISQPSIFLILGLCRKNVNEAMAKLKNHYQRQCSSKTFKKEELEGLTQNDMTTLKQLVETEGLYVQKDPSGSLTVSGSLHGVNQAMQMISATVHGNLRREVRVREEEDLYARVAWCILGQSGLWERLPKTDNYNLEHKELDTGIVDAQGLVWKVDLQQMKARRTFGAQTKELKRLQNLPDFTLPLNWDNMVHGVNTMVIPLETSTAEYRRVKEGFRRTVAKTVMKIERLQNVHLRRAYEARKKQISDKNAQEGGAHEKFLYHGTTQDNCSSIVETGFNRRFSGQNATSYGHGTYFALNASYSAHPTYSKPAADGTQLMFVVRVLTGIYTQGQSNMRVPPLRNSQNSHDRYDSVVDKMDNPNMFVVFHDNQAYPDYLITFK